MVSTDRRNTLHVRIDAPWLLDGPINGESFTIYVEKVLIPDLKPGDIVIADNLASHKAKAIRQAIRAAGARPPQEPRTTSVPKSASFSKPTPSRIGLLPVPWTPS